MLPPSVLNGEVDDTTVAPNGDGLVWFSVDWVAADVAAESLLPPNGLVPNVGVYEVVVPNERGFVWASID